MHENILVGRCLSANVPAILWGQPGIGKTARLRGYAREASMPIWVVVPSHYDPVELHGVLSVRPDGTVARALPDWAGPEIFDDGIRSILFFDEISTASPSQQASMLRLISERELGGRRISAGCRIVAAANPPECASGGWELSAPAANRFAHVYCTVHADDFVRHFPGLWAGSDSGIPVLPDPSAEQQAAARSLIAAFLRRRPELLHQMPSAASRQGGPWPSPRSWDLCSRLIAGAIRDIDTVVACATATVGDSAAAELTAWLRSADLPDPREILDNPESAAVPGRGDILYAALTSVAELSLSRGDKQSIRAAWIYCARAASAGHADVAAVAVRELIARGSKVYLPMQDPHLLHPFRRLLQVGK